MASQSEPRNPFYLLLLFTGLLFIVTVLAYAVIPVLEQKAMDAGTMPPASPFRTALRENGAIWVLLEVAALVILGLLSMGLDRYRRWKLERTSAPTPPDASAATQVDSPPPKC
jgi:hypothetical protein